MSGNFSFSLHKKINIFLYLILIIFILSACEEKEEKKKLKEEESIQKSYESGPINMELKINKKEITIAETLHLILDVKIKKEYEVEFPAFEEKLNKFQIRDSKYNSPKLIDKDHINVSMEYYLEPYLSGEYKIPRLIVYFRSTEEGEENKHQIETQEVTIKVTSLLQEDYKNLAIKDIQDPLTPPSKFLIILFIIIISTIFLSAVIVFIIIYLKKRRKEIKINYISAYRLALDRLDVLIKDNLIEKNKIKVFYYGMSAILRKYIEDRFRVNAPEQTTEEFLENLKKNRGLFKHNEKTILKDFLNHCDIVKYAKHSPDKQEIQNTFDLCKEFISQTRDDNVLLPENDKGVKS